MQNGSKFYWESKIGLRGYAKHPVRFMGILYKTSQYECDSPGFGDLGVAEC